jgi:hypothetical protein
VLLKCNLPRAIGFWQTLGGSVEMLKLHGLASSRTQHDHMTDSRDPPESPPIDESTGPWSHVPVLSVNGLCVAIVGKSSDLDDVTHDLLKAMKEYRSPSGKLLFAPARKDHLSVQKRKELADRGISIRQSDTEDVMSAARGILTSFWRRHLVIQQRYQAAGE